MSQKNKGAKLAKVQSEIESILRQLDQCENDHTEISEAEETLAIELSELQKKEQKIIAKLKP